MESVSPQILTVSQINSYLKSVIEGDGHLNNILLTGEISRYTVARSGHVYLTLKDKDSAISAVMWRSTAARLKFHPEDGMKVIVSGSVTVYPKRGEYQFSITSMQPDGIGALSLAFEQLKKKLEKEGLFAEEHKKSLPLYPLKIGVVTSPTTAAFQDVLKVLKRRWPLAEVTICPAQVQGDQAPRQIVSALKTIDKAGMDVILLVRGGGSIEDLWCFNDETVARTVYACKTPIVTGVGHEIDTTLVDFVADSRQPTPSAAAEYISPNSFDEYDRILQMRNRLRACLQNQINTDRNKIQYWQSSNVLSGIPNLINERRMTLERLDEKITRSIETLLDQEENKLWQYKAVLKAHSPQNILSLSRSKLDTLEKQLTFYNPVHSFPKYRNEIDKAMTQIRQGTNRKIEQGRNSLGLFSGKLDAYSPLKSLARGYSVAQKEDGTVVKRTDQLTIEEKFSLKLSDGTVFCRTEDIQKEENQNG